MKVFAIITAVAMSTTGGIYYFTQSGCPFQGACEKSQSTCTSCTAAAKPSCCEQPCPGCATNCQECCDLCELCCSASATVPVNASSAPAASGDEDFCPACAGPAKTAESAAAAAANLK
jgi:hypothetical protein